MIHPFVVLVYKTNKSMAQNYEKYVLYIDKSENKRIVAKGQN